MGSLASVVSLLFSRRPPAIVWRVWPVIIDAVDGEFKWSWPHIGQKVLERQPSITDDYSTPAVVKELWMARIGAAVFHLCPSMVFWPRPHAMRFGRFAELHPLPIDASAGLRFAPNAGNRFASAITVRIPKIVEITAMAKACKCKASASMSGPILHGFKYDIGGRIWL